MATARDSATVVPPSRRHLVKRDMELVRRILFEVQDKTSLAPEPLQLVDVDHDYLGRHIEMLFDEGMLDGFGKDLSHLGYKQVWVKDLTWSGHDFVAALRNDGVWHKIKTTLSPFDLATMPLNVLKGVAVDLLKKYIEGQLGL